MFTAIVVAWRIIALLSFSLILLSNPIINLIIWLYTYCQKHPLFVLLLGFFLDEGKKCCWLSDRRYYLEGTEKHTSKPFTRCDKDILMFFGVSEGLQVFFNVGLLAAIIITTIIASLACRTATTFSYCVLVKSNHVHIIRRINLLLEASVLCSSACWMLAFIHEAIVGYELDEVYIGTKDKRAADEKTYNKEIDNAFTTNIIMGNFPPQG